VKLISTGQNVEGKAQRDALIAQVARSAASAQRALNHQGAGVDGRVGDETRDSACYGHDVLLYGMNQSRLYCDGPQAGMQAPQEATVIDQL
jgi:hypothetical protein